MKSILPADLEAKRVAIAKTPNKLVILLLLAMFIFFFFAVAPILAPHRNPYAIFEALLLCLVDATYGLYRVFKYDEQLCRRYGFCAHIAKSPCTNHVRT